MLLLVPSVGVPGQFTEVIHVHFGLAFRRQNAIFLLLHIC